MDNKEIIRQLNDAWLNIDVRHKDVFNPFQILTTEDPEEFHMKLTWLMMQPEYFSFICKHILNIDLLPMQCLILKEIWGRKFPMLVASRGFGKAIRPDEKIRIPYGWKAIKDIEVGDKVYASDGKLCNVTFKTDLQKNLKMYRIYLEDGREIDCCENHMWKVWDGQWQELKTKNMLENCTHYYLPINKPIEDIDVDLPLHPYIVGVLLGASSLTSSAIITTKNEIILDQVRKLLPYGYQINRGLQNPAITKYNKDIPNFSSLCETVGIWGYSMREKLIPDLYKFSGRWNCEFLLRGLMDASGEEDADGNYLFSTQSSQLQKDVVDLARSLGLKCYTFTKTGTIGDTYFVKINPHDNKVQILDIKLIDDGEGYCIQVDSPDSTYITKDYIVTHNTFILSLYCMLRALLLPRRKIVVVGAAFRQSKFLYEYMETIWKNAPILQDICDKSSGPRSQIDMCRMTLNGSVISALPIGDGCLSPYTLTTYDDRIGELITPSKSIYGNKKFRKIDYNIDNGTKPTKIVTTKKGYSYEATYNHAMRVLREGKVQWVRTDDMIIGDRILIDRSERWHNNSELSEVEGYGLGLIIADGSLSKKGTIGFATDDLDLAMGVKQLIDLCPVSDKTLVWNGENDPEHWCCHSVKLTEWFQEHYEIIGSRSHDKEFPKSILRSNKSTVAAFISGLMDGDGHVFVNSSKGGTTISVNFTNTSKRLVEQLQYILLHFGIVSTVNHRDRNKKWNRVYELGIYGPNVKKFAEKIGFRLKRKQQKLLDAIARRKTWNSFDDNIPLDVNLVVESLDSDKKIPSRFSKSKILSKKSFQQKFLMDILPYCNSPEWEQLVNPDIFYDTIKSIEDSECHTYDIHVPDGNEYCANGFFSHNSKIRGMRANDIIADEFASMSREIFENVIVGFAAVSAKPSENVQRLAMEKKAKELNFDLSLLKKPSEEAIDKSNQIVLSGTAYYDFNHFSAYWKKWKTIIETGGDPHFIQNNVFNGEPVPSSFNWKEYSVIRIPVDLIPPGFMDEGQIARSKATVHNGIYLMEFGAVFAKDSQGFFKRSLIESCVGTKDRPILLGDKEVYFDPMLKGNSKRRYIMGVDPASEVDNFSIVILEVHEDHRRIVYSWTTTRQGHTAKVQKKLVDDNNFYSYCARKIRELTRLFNVEHIAMDAQGGGIAVYEALHDSNQLKPDELPFWEVIEDDKPKETDDQAGLHIIEMCQFARYDWYSEANHGLKKDFEDKILIFPRFDPVTIGLSIEEDNANNRLYDTLEDCVMEIEELKNELSLIEISASVNGRERWDTPEVKIGVGKKQRMRKDRYSALLMANMAARRISGQLTRPEYKFYGGFAEVTTKKKDENTSTGFTGPAWFTEKMNNVY